MYEDEQLSICNIRPVNDDHEKFPAGHESVTFVGRPFPLEEAHEHFSRLRRWGLTFGTFHDLYSKKSSNEYYSAIPRNMGSR